MNEVNSTTEKKTRDAAMREIAVRLGVRAEEGRRCAELTSLRVGGAVDWLLLPETEEQAASMAGELDAH
ncbi:MAG: hypothetical protein M3R15_04670, partial [Acidobacteriota bacterium]|nr:hypothetical protein [Acidobacteriota bacterium]